MEKEVEMESAMLRILRDRVEELSTSVRTLTTEDKKQVEVNRLLTSTYRELAKSGEGFERVLKEQFKQSKAVRDSLKSLGKTEEELRNTTSLMISAIFGEIRASKDLVKAFKEQSRAAEQNNKKLEQSVRVGKMLEFSTKSLSGKIETLSKGLSKVVGWKASIGGAIGLTLGVKELGSTLTKFNRDMFEATRISSRYGESMGDVADGVALASQKTTLSKMTFANINKSFKEMYIGIPPTTKALAIFASELQKNVGYSAEVTTKKMQDLLSLQSRMPDVLDRVSNIMKAYSNNTGQGDKMTTSLYLRMKSLGLSAKEVRETMAMIKPPSTETAGLMKMEKSVADLEKAKQDAQLAVAQKTEPMLIGVNKAAEVLASTIGGLNKITMMTVASLMGMAAVVPILASVGRGMGSMQNFMGDFMKFSKVTQGGGRGSIAQLTAMMSGGRSSSDGGGSGGGSALLAMEGVRRTGGTSNIGATLGRIELLNKHPKITPIAMNPSVIRKMNKGVIESTDKVSNAIKQQTLKTAGSGSSIGGVKGAIGGAVGVVAAAVIGYQIGKAINENVMKLFGKEGKLSDKMAKWLIPTPVDKNVRASENKINEAKHALASAGVNLQKTGLYGGNDRDEAKFSAKVIPIVMKIKSEQEKINVATKLYNLGIIRSTQLEKILGTSIKDRKELAKKINEITKIGNNTLGSTTNIIQRIGESTDAVVKVLQTASEQAGNLRDKLVSAMDRLSEAGVDPGVVKIGVALNLVSLQADLLAKAAGKRAAQGLISLAGEGKNMVNVLKTLLPGQDVLINNLAKEEAVRKNLQTTVNNNKDALDEFSSAESKASIPVQDLQKRIDELQKMADKGMTNPFGKEATEFKDKVNKLKVAQAELAKAQKDTGGAETKYKQSNAALETHNAILEKTRKAALDAVGTPSFENQAKAIEEANKKIIELQNKMAQTNDKGKIEKYGSEIAGTVSAIEILAAEQAAADNAILSGAEKRAKAATESEDAQIKNSEATKNLRTAYMEAQKAYGLGPTASVVAMKQVSAEINKQIDLLKTARSNIVEAAGKPYKVDFKKMGFDPEALLRSGQSVEEVIKTARKFSEEVIGLSAPGETHKFNIEATKMTNKLNDSLVKSANLMRENANLTKEMREGWLSANKEFIANAGVFSGIIPTMSKGITAFKEIGAQVFEEAVGKAGTFGKRKKGKFRPPKMYGGKGDVGIENVGNLGGEVGRQWTENTSLKTLELLFESMQGQDTEESRRLGRRILEVRQAKEVKSPNSKSRVDIPSADANIDQSFTSAPAAIEHGKSTTAKSNTAALPLSQGGPTESGYVISKQKTDQYKDLIAQLNPSIVQGGVAGKDSVFISGIGWTMPGEAIVTGDEESALAEMINKGQIDGMARGGSTTRTNRRNSIGGFNWARTKMGNSSKNMGAQLDYSKRGSNIGQGIVGGFGGNSSSSGKASSSSALFTPYLGGKAKRNLGWTEPIPESEGEKERKRLMADMPEVYGGTKSFASGGRLGQNNGIRTLASGGAIQVPRGLAKQFASSPASSGGGEMTLKLNPEVRDLLVADGKTNYRSGTRI